MDEYESIKDYDCVSQGDVIEWVGEHRKSPWQVFGVVVTADCDLVWKKHKGYISYVPAWSIEDFVWHHWRVDTLSKLAEAQFNKLATRLTNWRTKRGGSPITSEATRLWLRRVGSQQLLDELGVTDLGERNGLMHVIEPAQAIDAALCCTEPNMPLLAKAYALIKKSQNAWSDIEKDVTQYCKSLPGDIFHLPSRPDGEDGDLFLMLRHIRQIVEDELTARPDDIRSGLAKAKRVARVSAPFRYAITQNLGKVFADIGLPNDYDNRRSLAANRFFERWTKI